MRVNGSFSTQLNKLTLALLLLMCKIMCANAYLDRLRIDFTLK